MVDTQAPLAHHFFEVAVTHGIPQVPPNTQEDESWFELTPFERMSLGMMGIRSSRCQRPSILKSPARSCNRTHGIGCEIRRSRSGPLSDRPWPELWVIDASQTEQARRIVQAALDKARHDELGVAQALESGHDEGIDRGLEADDESPQGSLSWTWTCPQCREDVEVQFSECWNCGSERPDQKSRVTELPGNLSEE